MRAVWHLKLLAFGLVVISLSAAPILADPVAVDAKTVVTAPDWVLGSTWYYSDGYALKVTSVAAGTTVFDRLDAPGQWFSRQGFLRKDLTSGTATRTSIFRTIPDQAGLSLRAGSPLTFQREYLENGALVVHASSWSVEGRETVTVPAGTFDCWVIVWRTRSLRTNWTGFERWWYSPTAQNYVRMEYKYGPGDEGSRVLMRYQIGAPPAQKSADAQPVVEPDSAGTPEKTAMTEPPSPPPVIAKAASGENAPASTAPDSPRPQASVPAPDNDSDAIRPAAAAMPMGASPVPEPEPDKAPKPAKGATSASARKPNAAEAKSADANAPSTPHAGSAWHAQVASSKDEAAVRKSLDKILVRYADVLKGVPSQIASAKIGERGVFYRAWLGEFDRSADANSLCTALRASGANCLVLKSPRGDAEKLASRL